MSVAWVHHFGRWGAVVVVVPRIIGHVDVVDDERGGSQFELLSLDNTLEYYLLNIQRHFIDCSDCLGLDTLDTRLDTLNLYTE